MDNPTIEVEGIADLRRALRGVEGGTDDLKATHAKAAAIVDSAARPPRVSGSLAASVRSSGQAKSGVVRAGSARVPYAGPIHFGWRRRNIRAQPFLTDALDRKTPAVVDTYEAELAALLRRHGLA